MPTVYWHSLHVWDDSSQIWLTLFCDGQGHFEGTLEAKLQAVRALFLKAHHTQRKPIKEKQEQGLKIKSRNIVVVWQVKLI